MCSRVSPCLYVNLAWIMRGYRGKFQVNEVDSLKNESATKEPQSLSTVTCSQKTLYRYVFSLPISSYGNVLSA
jgi:hypothetical protein